MACAGEVGMCISRATAARQLCRSTAVTLFNTHTRTHPSLFPLTKKKITARPPLPQGIMAARSRPTMQRIVVKTSMHDVEYLGNSYSDSEYSPSKR